jgi:hypothetical protein
MPLARQKLIVSLADINGRIKPLKTIRSKPEMLPLTRSENRSISFFMSHLLRWLMVVGYFHLSNKKGGSMSFEYLGCGHRPR